MGQMDMDRFEQRQEAIAANSGLEFGDIPKLVVTQGVVVRLIGNFTSAWEHFVNMPSGARPYICEGPESDCPICRAAQQLAVGDDPVQQQLAKDIRAKEKFFFNVLDRSPIGKSQHSQSRVCSILTQTPKGFSIGSQLFKNIGNVVRMRKATGQSHDPNTFDIMLTKVGTGMQTQYGAQFTGITDALTPEELAYKQWPLEDIARISPMSERQVAADFILGGASVKQETKPAANINAPRAAGPVQMQQRAPAVAPPPAQPPRMQPQQRMQPAQAPAPAPAVAKLQIKPAQATYQSTAPRATDPAVDISVPCDSCGADMIISMEDGRDIQCHSCGKVFVHPAKS